MRFRVPSVSLIFNGAVKIEFSDDRITSNAGVLLLREADGKLGLIRSIADRMVDPRKQGLREGYGT
jgi:hypothetical protein